MSVNSCPNLSFIFIFEPMATNTPAQFDEQIKKCRSIFEKKTHDYGTSWRVLRPKSLTDQLFIKAQRIQTIEEAETRMVDEDESAEFIGLINYAIMGLIQMELKDDKRIELPPTEALLYYEKQVAEIKDLMMAKNHDYGEAWRDMRVSSFTDLILMKLLRIKQIEDNKGKTLISEGIDAGYRDIVNYSIFALIKLSEQTATK
ncbi:MAG TPA: DUF1599 domain-containing protein [Chitinophagales bacterium]|nr:DUF1599 domain-containing protein [Chitinophagales bacterium]